MGSVNKVILVGNLGRDAELRFTPGGAAGREVQHRDDRGLERQGGPAAGTDRVAQRRLCGASRQSPCTEYLVKGKQVYVEGRICRRDEYTTRTASSERAPKVRCDQVVLLGSGGGRGGGMSRSSGGDDMGGHASGPGQDTPDQPLTDDDIPF